MRCKKIEELLKSDYLDGELKPKEAEFLNRHLKGCGSCRKLEEGLQAQRAFFRQVKPQEAPQRVWHNISNAVAAERLNQEAVSQAGFFTRLKDALLVSHPRFALASAFAVMILIAVFAGTFMQKRAIPGVADSSDIIAVYSLSGENGSLLYDLGTNIEEYFL